ncbi:TetR/AcrR family transcriptional regulator [Nocardia uniformis]|uniref:TetR/AcrR family transcriptional regulator n=1 Tax=Nocardia uniformis TaxID=53432 RepID=A0A849BY15_9NOCA|nr:TetR/AcrR family transcriptional regulator [Nocardia uniformis]NNH69976.1 TetR/AcrR family transcriptional regulator [Nocardia uniformis]
MNSADQRTGRPRRGSVDKREATLVAARKVFGRVGYLGASIDMIAAEAQVSTRTIYNHFTNKEQLFALALTESSGQVAAAHEALIERYLHDGVTAATLETALVELAREWRRPDARFAEHFAIVRRIHAEGEDFPPELVDSWRESGPRRVQRALVGHMARLGERGLLRLENPVIAAQHYIALITNDLSADSTGEQSDAQTDDNAETGVRTFLYGHLPRG